MIKLTKGELTRKWINNRIQLKDGMTLQSVLDKVGPDSIFEREVGYYDSSDEWFVTEQRLETDEEYDARIAKIKAAKQAEIDRKAALKAKKEADERRTYLRLKKKFEGKES